MTADSRPLLLQARGVLPRASRSCAAGGSPGRVWRDAGVLVEAGRVVQLVEGHAARRRLSQARGARVQDLGDVCLAPGLVNAHAHLELTGLAGCLPGDRGFGAWVGALLAARAGRSAEQLAQDARRGLAESLASGTTCLGDIASTDAVLTALVALGRRPRPRVRVYRELLDAWDPERTGPALERVRHALPQTGRLFEGFSPHAPFTVSRELLRGIARIRRRRPRPVSMHWAETQAELDWMASGSGEFAGVLGGSPRRSGLDLLDEAGLLGPWTSLVHGNLPARGEPERLAGAGASLVHCPGTHEFFSRGSFPLAAYERAGVNLALGTDSLASNSSLSLAGEAARLLEREPGLSPWRVLGMATEGGARALGLGSDVGRLEPGFLADCLVLPLVGGRTPPDAEALAESLFLGPGAGPSSHSGPAGVLLGGRLAGSV